ncbi:MAG: PqqD family protein [Nocardiopsaceae bacterium]|nr:PqqD family protein [Nocardiopsaceae bacterium]
MPDIENDDERLLPSRHVRAIITSQGGAILDLRPRRGRWYTLTSTACFWWQCIQDGRTTGEASRAVAGKYEIPAQQAAADLAPFQAEMLRKRLLMPASRRRTARQRH